MAAIPEGSRKSDRWITPGVLIAVVIAAAVLVLVLAGYCAWLLSRGVDPGPLVDMVTKIGTATAALAGVLLQLVGRPTQAKVERNTGVLAGYVADLADQVAAVSSPALPATSGGPSTVAATSVPEPGDRALPPVPSSGFYSQLKRNAPQ